ncbi:substrate-binding domain-containing protein [Vallitalea maricola]|uniref:Sugar-binding protein n=1 Tax=Vallitalea maricola TaxID=3074433 RepID=A0ACB5UQE5_9FIRM|nr:sugar-binding protein [Vallitalea sp. AN17-2]
MKKVILGIIIGILSLVLIISLGLSFLYMKDVNYSKEQKFNKDKDSPKYHLMVISNDINTLSGETFLKGLNDASHKMKVALEINDVKKEDINEQLDYINIAIASKVDGIILQVTDNEKIKEAINHAVDMGVPVVTVFEDVPASKRQSYVGSNSFEIGEKAGKLVSDAIDNKGEIAIILDNIQENDYLETSKNLILSGFKDITNKYDEMEIKKVEESKLGLLGAEDIISKIINSYPNISAIFCSSVKDTIGVAQVIVDLNKVGDISIVGYGDSEEVLKYIEKHVIDASIVDNPYDIGYKSIDAILEVITKGTTSSFYDTGVNIITNDNIDDYTNKRQKSEGDES